MTTSKYRVSVTGNNAPSHSLRNKIAAIEKQNRCFQARLRAFNHASRWQRLVMAWKGQI